MVSKRSFSSWSEMESANLMWRSLKISKHQRLCSMTEKKSLLEQVEVIFVFAGPALSIWLSGLLMSLIDAAVIGNCSTLELAALGPGTVFYVQTSFVFTFLSIETSNLNATAFSA